MHNGLSFDGATHYPVVVPSSVSELSELVRQTRSNNQALYPFGGKTMLDLGQIPSKPGPAVDMRSLNNVIDYPSRDMTITIQAGIAIQRLNEILQAEKQRLAVDIPFAEQATVGGAIAANASGPRRLGLGTLRDYVIGISSVNDKGFEVKAGGRVVKNVAGYDLMKLHTGALGTLGIITQVTLKLKPLPESSQLLVLPIALENASGLLDALFASQTRPVCVDLLDPGASKVVAKYCGCDSFSEGWNFVVGYEDNFKAVTWQVERLRQEISAEMRASLRECSDNEAERLWKSLSDFALFPDYEFSFKANMLPNSTLDFCGKAATGEPTPILRAHAGNGIVTGHCKGLSLEQAMSMVEKLGVLAAAAKGNLIVTRCPAGWKSVLPIWGRSTGDRTMMKMVKQKLDPAGVFNPGRFVDGI